MQTLIVDDDSFALKVLERTLSRMGYSTVPARDGNEAMEILRRGEIRLVVTDWDMPGMNGVELCRAIRREDFSGYVYIIMLTGREGAKQRMEGLYAGADDFLNKPLDPEELLVCLKGAERILSLETRNLALFALAKLAESRDPDTGAHVERVQTYARLIAQNLSAAVKSFNSVDDEYIRLLYQTSPLHDLGKVAIPDAILLKPGKLTADEFAVMKTHTLLGSKTLDAAQRRFPNAKFLQMAREIAATHHEKFDGSGYPLGLVGERIPLCGRIVAVADVYDALTSRRVYKSAMTHEQATAIIRGDSGSHFDPEIVESFLRAEKQIIAARERLRDTSEPALPPMPIPAAPPPGQCGASPCKIVIAEDDPLLLKKLTELLSATGETVFATCNGREALKVLEEQNARVVVSDWVMPEMDGVALCRTIRARTGREPVHFIMLTAHSDKSRLLDAYEAGVDDFVSKPFDPEELLARVRAGLRGAKLHDELSRKATGSQALNGQLAVLNSRLERLSVTDELTGMFNRRYAMTRLDELWPATGHGMPLSVASIDIDHFKQVNDTWGHDAGDAILQQVAGVLRGETRGSDAVCRVGGEEFLIIFPSQSIQEAGICAERCRRTVAAHPFTVGQTPVAVTVSIGLATRTREMTQPAHLLKAVDEAVYAAKRAGRHVVCVAEQPKVAEAIEQAGGDPAPAPAAEAPADTSRAPIDMNAVLKRCGGDPAFAAAVTARFQNQAGGEVAKIEQALTAGDFDTLGRAAHTLKSMAAYMSADSASSIAGAIEDLVRTNRVAEAAPLVVRLRAEIDGAIAWLARNQGTGTLKCA
jgi:putative two-component system response regulator